MDRSIAEKFERELVRIVIAEAKTRGLNFAQLARLAYGDNDSSVVKWRAQRREEKPQQLSIAEAYQLAQGLGLELPDLIFRVQASMRMKSSS